MSKPKQSARAGAAPLTGTQPGLVVAGFGRHVLVETESGQRVICHPRGKKSQVVVGDRIRWLPSQDEGTIEKIEERSNLFYRQDEMRTKSFAANLDQVLILIAAEPEFSESQLTRALIAAEAERITPIIALNKSLHAAIRQVFHIPAYLMLRRGPLREISKPNPLYRSADQQLPSDHLHKGKSCEEATLECSLYTLNSYNPFYPKASRHSISGRWRHV